MKKLTTMIAMLTLALCLSACNARSYEEGYADGYNDGYSDAEFEIGCLVEDEFQDGYEAGYEDGYDDGSVEGWINNIEDPGRYFKEEAVHYASEHSEWHPEEAWYIIEAYHNNEPFYENGSPPSKQDYLNAIDSLIYFYEYFYGRHYE